MSLTLLRITIIFNLVVVERLKGHVEDPDENTLRQMRDDSFSRLLDLRTPCGTKTARDIIRVRVRVRAIPCREKFWPTFEAMPNGSCNPVHVAAQLLLALDPTEGETVHHRIQNIQLRSKGIRSDTVILPLGKFIIIGHVPSGIIIKLFAFHLGIQMLIPPTMLQ